MLVYGFINSAILVLLTLGFNLTFGISRIANFSYGAIYVLSGFVLWIFLNKLHLPFSLSFLLVLLIMGVGSTLFYSLFLKRIRGLVISEVIATFSLGIVILEFLRFVGFIGFEFSLPVLIKDSVKIMGTYVDLQRLFILLFMAVLLLLLYLFTHHTKIGLAFRGIAQEEHTSLSLGINPDRIAALSMGLGAALGSFASILLLPLGTISVDEGYDVLIKVLSVCIVGGLGSNLGILFASLIIGFAQTFTAFYISPHWTVIASFLAIIFILAIKPSGIFGHQKELEERV